MKQQKKKLTFIEFTSRSKRFGSIFRNFGLGLLVVTGVLSLFFLWTIVYTYYEPYKEIAVMFLRLLNLGVNVSLVGILTYYLFNFIEEILIKREMRKYGTK